MLSTTPSSQANNPLYYSFVWFCTTYNNNQNLAPTNQLLDLLKCCKIQFHLQVNDMATIVDPSRSGYFDYHSFCYLCKYIQQDNEVQKKIWEKSNKYVDLCFLVDLTESMDKMFENTKKVITDIITEINKSNKDISSIRYAFVGYRDLQLAEAHQYVVEPFSFDKQDVLAQLSYVQCFGGADYPEDVDGGLKKVLELDWASFTRVLIHITDAPGHGEHYHNFSPKDDDFYYKSHSSVTEHLVKQLVSKKIDYFFFEIHECTRKMTQKFGQWMKEANSQSKENMYEITVEPISGGVESCTFLQKVSHMIMQSFNLSTIRLQNRKEAIKKISELVNDDDDPPEWNYVKNQTIRKGKVLSFGYFGSAEEFCTDLLNIGFNSFFVTAIDQDICIDFEHELGRGAERVVYKAYNPQWKVKMVVKKCFDCHSVEEQIEKCKTIAMTHAAARVLSDHFSKQVRFGIKFIDIKLLVFENKDGEITEIYTLEPFIDGEYKKYFGNSGFIGDLRTFNMGERNIYHTSQAFAHWTFEVSKRRLMVADIQGVHYTLTDPAILTMNAEEQPFSQTDTGPEGIQQFFHTHQCNEICQQLNLSTESSSGISGARLFPSFSENVAYIRYCEGFCCGNYREYKIGEQEIERNYFETCDTCRARCKITHVSTCKVKSCPLKFRIEPWYWLSKGKTPPSKCNLHRGTFGRNHDWKKEKRVPYDAEYQWQDVENYLNQNPDQRKFLEEQQCQKELQQVSRVFWLDNCPNHQFVERYLASLNISNATITHLEKRKWRLECEYQKDADIIRRLPILLFENRMVGLLDSKPAQTINNSTRPKKNPDLVDNVEVILFHPEPPTEESLRSVVYSLISNKSEPISISVTKSASFISFQTAKSANEVVGTTVKMVEQECNFRFNKKAKTEKEREQELIKLKPKACDQPLVNNLKVVLLYPPGQVPTKNKIIQHIRSLGITEHVQIRITNTVSFLTFKTAKSSNLVVASKVMNSSGTNCRFEFCKEVLQEEHPPFAPHYNYNECYYQEAAYPSNDKDHNTRFAKDYVTQDGNDWASEKYLHAQPVHAQEVHTTQQHYFYPSNLQYTDTRVSGHGMSNYYWTQSPPNN